MKTLAKKVISGSAYVAFVSWGLLRRMTEKRSAPLLAETGSILLVRLNLLGDLLFTLPAVASLRAAAPGARITMLVLPYTADLLRSSGLVDRIVTADINRWRNPSVWLGGAAAAEIREVLSEVRREAYDLCISFYGRIGAAFALASGARYTVGYESEGYPASFDLALPDRRYRTGGHEVDYCMALVKALGASGPAAIARLAVDSDAAESVESLLRQEGIGSGDRMVAVHPGALNMAAKRWAPARWAELGDRLQRDLGTRVVLVGSSSELPLAEAVRQDMVTSPADLSGKTSVPELAALLRRCDLFLGGDSGPLHLASVLGVPSVSVFGPTDPANTGPVSPEATVLSGSAACIPCYRLDRPAVCWRGDLLCMAQVTVDDVFHAALARLTRKD